MARETIWLCDVDSQPDETVRTYTVRTDGKQWEIDLCDKHFGPIARILAKGRVSDVSSRSRDASKTLEGMVRNPPGGKK